VREADPQFVADKENEDRTKGRKNKAGRMVSHIGRSRKDVSYRPAEDRTDNAEHDRPKDRHMNVHDRFGDRPGD
jgi:hypothetical protein